jgi:pSer/pThr/pTyr-binding forkhead associated (FHA) protein
MASSNEGQRPPGLSPKPREKSIFRTNQIAALERSPPSKLRKRRREPRVRVAMGVRLAIESVESDGTRVLATLELDQPRIVLGRGAAADVILPHASVSAVHASLRSSASGYTIVDERSTNGTRVGDVRLIAERPRALRAGEVVRIGPYSISITPGIAVANASTSEDATAAAKRLVRMQSEGAPLDERALVFVTGSRAGDQLRLPDAGVWLLGRGEDVQVHIDDAASSRHHAEIVADANGVVVRDAGSKNGVVINGRLMQSRRLRDGDELTVGATQIAYVDLRDRAVSAVAREPVDAEPPEEPPAPPPPAASPGDDDAHGFDDGARRPDEHTFDIVEEPAAPSLPVAKPGVPIANDVLADRFVFGLALVVLGLSAAAMAWIFGGA